MQLPERNFSFLSSNLFLSPFTFAFAHGLLRRSGLHADPSASAPTAADGLDCPRISRFDPLARPLLFLQSGYCSGEYIEIAGIRCRIFASSLSRSLSATLSITAALWASTVCVSSSPLALWAASTSWYYQGRAFLHFSTATLFILPC